MWKKLSYLAYNCIAQKNVSNNKNEKSTFIYINFSNYSSFISETHFLIAVSLKRRFEKIENQKCVWRDKNISEWCWCNFLLHHVKITFLFALIWTKSYMDYRNVNFLKKIFLKETYPLTNTYVHIAGSRGKHCGLDWVENFFS